MPKETKNDAVEVQASYDGFPTALETIAAQLLAGRLANNKGFLVGRKSYRFANLTKAQQEGVVSDYVDYAALLLKECRKR